MQIKYGGPMFPDSDGDRPSDKKIKQILDNTYKDICKCGHKMEKDAKFCSNCGLSREEALRDNLTADEKRMLIYIKEQNKDKKKVNFINLYDLRNIPFFKTILERFEKALHGLAKKGYITFANGIAQLKKPAP